MSIKIGIPGALYYYRYFPLWKTFFEELGAEVIVSRPTNRTILDAGVRNCVEEACLPVKIFHGHVIDLRDRVDYIFIPRLTSMSRNEYICPKFGGLPDLVRHSLKDLPEIIGVEVNLRKSAKEINKAAEEAGKYITDSKKAIRKALDKGLAAQKMYEASQRVYRKQDSDNTADSDNTDIDNTAKAYSTAKANNAAEANNGPEAYSTAKANNAAEANNGPKANSAVIANNAAEANNGPKAYSAVKANNAAKVNNAAYTNDTAKANNAAYTNNAAESNNAAKTNNAEKANNTAKANFQKTDAKSSSLKIAVIGHPYLLYDRYINMNLLEKLKNMGAEIVTPEMVDEQLINTYASGFSKPLFWNSGRILSGSALYMADECDIDGMVFIMSFGCGIDAFICDLIERRIRRGSDLPLIIFTIDEQTGEAGLNTRLEAFIDMILWRKSNENNISASG